MRFKGYKYQQSPHIKESTSSKNCCSNRSRILQLDKNSAVLFPAIFLVFNLIYWAYFVMIQ